MTVRANSSNQNKVPSPGESNEIRFPENGKQNMVCSPTARRQVDWGMEQNIALMSLHQLEAGHCFAIWFGVRSQLQQEVLGRISLPQLLKSKTASETLPC